ncbi:cytochrome b/b6 domain-containing protein [Pseudomonas sp. dw_358]|uniref:cytochrome b n=1 Tax=Pseudomonas sp. dw_358 TaxID=2720083 RepID=UPI001BD69562|nr:cytochrome b/b6 domain-containing protein [Pseudomonas sp. dw_358]
MSAGRYSPVRIALHWLSAAFILWALIMGAYAGTLAEDAPLRTGVAALNVSLATLFIPLFAWRLWLRLRAERQAPKTLAEHAAHWAHNLLYLLTGAVLVTGVLMMNRPIRVFDWLTLPQPLHDPALLHRLMQVHAGSCAVLGALVLLHVLAVIKHEASGRRVLRRML